jgi:NAD(P)-dependent dehydrogenase (short-subunit alcohol dehydrogenase family)
MKNALVIGASGGIGFPIATKLSDSGYTVYGTYHRDHFEPGETWVDFHRLDVLGDDLDLNFLPDTLDALVYCPGSINLKPFARIKPEAFEDDYRLQVLGAIRVIQAVLKRLQAAQSASILLFSTVAVQQGFKFHSQVSASKGALEGLTRALAAEFAPRIRVNCIAPSLTDTPLAASLLSTPERRQANAERHPLGRVGNAEDIASMAYLLLTEPGSWISGQVISVDGGMSRIKG